MGRECSDSERPGHAFPHEMTARTAPRITRARSSNIMAGLIPHSLTLRSVSGDSFVRRTVRMNASIPRRTLAPLRGSGPSHAKPLMASHWKTQGIHLARDMPAARDAERSFHGLHHRTPGRAGL